MLTCLVALFLLTVPPAGAQVDTGVLSGQVTDQSGAAVRGATLTIESEATGYTRVVQNSGEGT